MSSRKSSVTALGGKKQSAKRAVLRDLRVTKATRTKGGVAHFDPICPPKTPSKR